MDGLMMDFQLTLPPLLRRAETFFGDQEVVTRLPDKSFHRYTSATWRGARSSSPSPSTEARARARRPGRDALLEPLPAPRGVLRHPVRRLRPPHAQPAAAPDDLALHRQARAATGSSSSTARCCRCSSSSGRDRHRARLRRRGLATRSCSRRGDRGRVARPGARRGRGRGHVLHERHDRPAEGRRLLAPLDRPARARRRVHLAARPAHRRGGHDPARSCRCSTRTRGATRTSRR